MIICVCIYSNELLFVCIYSNELLFVCIYSNGWLFVYIYSNGWLFMCIYTNGSLVSVCIQTDDYFYYMFKELKKRFIYIFVYMIPF